MSRRFLSYTLVLVALGLVSVRAQNPAEIASIELDKESVSTVCPISRPHTECNEDDARIRVRVHTKEVPKTESTYYYIPSGGRIMGSGPEVVWDLSEVPPGNYTISVGVGRDDVIAGETLSKTITVRECDVCDRPCSCPTIEIEKPKGFVTAGDAFIIRSRYTGSDRLAYKWTISAGTIIAGKNADSVLIRTSGSDAGKKIRVMLEISGTDERCNCPTVVQVSVLG